MDTAHDMDAGYLLCMLTFNKHCAKILQQCTFFIGLKITGLIILP